MNYIPIVNSYLSLNLLIIFVFLIFKAFRIKSSTKLQLLYYTLFISIVVAAFQPFAPKANFTNSTVKVWAAESMEGIQLSAEALPKAQIVSAQERSTHLPEATALIVLLMFAIVFVFFCIRFIREMLTLIRIKKTSYVFRKYGKVSLLINDEIQMPFSFWTPGRYYSIIPSSFFKNPEDFKVSLYHELQHHRQGDTKWVYPIIFLRALCFLNPFVHLLSNHISATQELACDEEILKANKVSSQNYISCLLRVAQTAVSREFDPVCAAGFCFNKGRHILQRRIQMMNAEQRQGCKWTKSLAMILVTMVVTVTVYGSQNLVQDKRISLKEAQQLVKNASKGSEFPIVVNSEVLVQLNRFLGTPEGREFIKSSLIRKKEFDQILTDVPKKYHTPYELNAIPIAESGYKNLPSSLPAHAAGLWMFIPGTAKKYGMKVEGGLDERLDAAKETDAAHRYLLSNKLLFNDWLLAIYAYNVGETAVQHGIKKYGTRDAWELSKYIKGDKDYLAKIMASIIIMKNPEVLEL